jgi:hypothetical protein
MIESRIEITPHKADFTLHCECGCETTYHSSCNERMTKGTWLECRTCHLRYYVDVDVKIRAITEPDKVNV